MYAILFLALRAREYGTRMGNGLANAEFVTNYEQPTPAYAGWQGPDFGRGRG
jgi:hypothetical protein